VLLWIIFICFIWESAAHEPLRLVSAVSSLFASPAFIETSRTYPFSKPRCGPRRPSIGRSFHQRWAQIGGRAKGVKRTRRHLLMAIVTIIKSIEGRRPSTGLMPMLTGHSNRSWLCKFLTFLAYQAVRNEAGQRPVDTLDGAGVSAWLPDAPAGNHFTRMTSFIIDLTLTVSWSGLSNRGFRFIMRDPETRGKEMASFTSLSDRAPTRPSHHSSSLRRPLPPAPINSNKQKKTQEKRQSNCHWFLHRLKPCDAQQSVKRK